MENIVDQAKVAVALDGRDAETVLNELTAKTEEYTTALTKAYQAGDKLGMKNALKDLKDTEKELANFHKQTFDVTKVLKDLNGTNLKDLKRAEAEITAELSRMKRGTEEYAAKVKDLKNVSSEIGRVRTEMKGASEGTGLFGKAMGGIKGIIATIGIGTLVAGLTSIGKQMFETRKEFEKYEAVLKNTLGSEDAARQAMNMITDSAAKLPISVKEATEGFIKLANRGIQPTQEELTKMTDIAMSQGKTLDMFIEGMLDAQTGEFERLKEFGIRASKEGDKVTFMFKNQSTTVQNNGEAIKNYLMSLGDLPGVAGSSAAVMNTLEGKVSNLGDSWDRLMNNMGKSTGGVLKTVMGWLNDLVDIWAGTFQSMDQIRQDVMDKQTDNNLKDALEEIQIIASGLIKGGMEEKKAQERAAVLYRESVQNSLNIAKEDLKIATGVSAEKLKIRIADLTKELESVDTYFKKQIELKKKQFEMQQQQQKKEDQKKLDDQKKYLQEVLMMGMNATEKENNEYAERLKKAGLFNVNRKKLTTDQLKALEILEKQHSENLEKINNDLKNSYKADEDKWNKAILDANTDANQAILFQLKQRYISELQAAGDNAEARKAVEEKYRKDYLKAEITQMEATATLMWSLGMNTLAIEQQIQDKKLEILNQGFKDQDQATKDHDAIRNELGLISLDEKYAKERKKIKGYHDEGKISEEEYEQALLNIRLKWLADTLREYAALTESMNNMVQGLQDAEIAKSQTKYQTELAQLEDKHNKQLISDDTYNKKKSALDKKQQEEEKKIKKKYADQAFAMQVAQIIASTAMAAIQAYQAVVGIPFVGPVLAPIAAAAAVAYGATQIAQAKEQRDQVKALAKGKYDVTGADDGQTYYSVPYIGHADTGIYTKPTLIAERGPELVVSAPHVRNLQMNYPQVLNAIMATRVPQYAEGSYVSASGSASMVKDSSQTDIILSALAISINSLNSKLDNLSAKVIMDEFKQVEARYNSIKTDVSKS